MEAVSTDHAMAALKRGLPFIRSGGDGEIFDANEAFEELTGYSAFELKRKGWKAISVQNEDLEADKAITAELVTGKRQSMTLIKSYVSKLGVPIPGQLLAIRFPQGTGPMECALCFFVPLANGSKAALSLVVDYIEKHTNASHGLAEKIATMAADAEIRKSQSKLQTMLYSILDWGIENPVKAGGIATALWVVMSTIPQIALRVGLPPQPVQIQMQDGHGNVRPATKSDLVELGVFDDDGNQDMVTKPADQVGFVAVAKTVSIQNGKGFQVSWDIYTDGRSGPVSIEAGQGRGFDCSAGGTGWTIGTMPIGTSF